jgi:hypothetical protein
MAPIVLHGPNAYCARPLESIEPDESIEIMVDREMSAPAKKVELSPWGRPKIKGCTRYRWDEKENKQ